MRTFIRFWIFFLHAKSPVVMARLARFLPFLDHPGRSCLVWAGRQAPFFGDPSRPEPCLPSQSHRVFFFPPMFLLFFVSNFIDLFGMSSQTRSDSPSPLLFPTFSGVRDASGWQYPLVTIHRDPFC